LLITRKISHWFLQIFVPLSISQFSILFLDQLRKSFGQEIDFLQDTITVVDSRIRPLPGSGILDDCLTSWEDIAYLNQVIGDMQLSLNLLMVKLQEQEAESKKLSSDYTKINAISTKSISELQSDLQTLMDIMKVFNEEHVLLVNRFQGTSSPSTATFVSYQDDINRLANRLAMCENTLGQSHHSSSSDVDIRSEVAQLKNLINAVDSKIPKFSTMNLGGKLYQSKNDVELFVASSRPSNAFHHFHDAVTILESLSSSFTEKERHSG